MERRPVADGTDLIEETERKMKKNSDLRWQTDVSMKTTKYSPAEFLIGLIVDGLLTGLVIFSAACMLRDVFPTLQIGKQESGRFVLLAASFLLLYEAIPYWWRAGKESLGIASARKRFLERGAFILASAGYLLGFYLYTRKNHLAMEDGMLYIAGCYLEKFNVYYKTNYTLGSRGDISEVSMTLGFWLMLIVTVLWILAKLWKKNGILLILPMAVLIPELMVGFTPKWQGIALYAFSALLLCSGEWENRAQGKRQKGTQNDTIRRNLPRLIVLGTAALLLLTGPAVFTAPVNRLMGSYEELRAFQQDLEEQVRTFSFASFTAGRADVNNRTPHYSGKEVLSVTASDTVGSNLYLRNFYGTAYKNGSWICDSGDFRSACEEAGFSPDDMTRYVASANQELEEELVTYDISYTGIWNKNVYLPYYMDSTSLEGVSSLSDDVTWKKSLFTREISVKGWYRNTIPEGNLWNGIMTKSDSAMGEWYNDYAMRYMETSDAVPAAGTFMDSGRLEEYLDMLNDPDFLTRNYARMFLADLVSNKLSVLCSYQLELPAITDGTDSVEYFLSESHEGYCMHFASAGTLILREMGVPARYASGYIVKQEAFVKNGDGSYTASVKDQNAHAWVEIYLDNIGWVPVEMTPGYSVLGQQLPTDVNVEGLTDSVTDTQSTEEESTPPAEEETEKETESGSEAEPETETEMQTGQEKEAHPADADGQGSFGGVPQGKAAMSWSDLPLPLRAAVCILLCAVLILLVIRIYRHRNMQYRRRLKYLLKKKRYRKAVRSMNRRIYKNLIHTGKIRKADFRDADYEALLCRSYQHISKEDWKRYMQIVKKAAFSGEEIEESDAGFCYQIYQDRNLKEK